MYSLENSAQPGVFKNALSGIWWAASTILTIGYGDIAPITTGGKIMSMIISFLGVGMVAVPTGIISAGFVEQYQKVKRFTDESEVRALRFVTSVVDAKHAWAGKLLKDIVFPPQLLLAVILRGDGGNEEEIIPEGSTRIQTGDTLVFAAKRYDGAKSINLQEVEVKDEHPWVDRAIRDLDISQLDLIVSIERRGKLLIPNGSTVIKRGDMLVIYSKRKQS
jgi:voltage-gated potassium channel